MITDAEILSKGMKVLLILRQQESVKDVRDILDDNGVLHCISGNEEKGIVVNITDVDIAEIALDKMGLGMNGKESGIVLYDIKEEYGISDIVLRTAHRLASYGVPCWILPDSSSLCVWEKDQGAAEECFNRYSRKFEKRKYL